MGKTILVISGKGGSGKSMLTVNCGAVLAGLNQKVLLIDTDLGLRSLDLLLSVENRVIYDLSDVIEGSCEASRAVISTEINNHLFLMPAPASACEDSFSAEKMLSLIASLKKDYDYIFIDSPAGVGKTAMMAAQAADLVIIVTTPEPVSIRDADLTASAVLKNGAKDIRLVINRVIPKLIKNKKVENLDAVIDRAAVRLLGIVPEDVGVIISSCAGKPLAPGRKGAAKAYHNIALRIAGEDVALMKL